MRTQGWTFRAVVIVAITLTLCTTVPALAGSAGAAEARSTQRSERPARSTRERAFPTRLQKKKPKKKAATGLMSKLRHALVVLVVVAVIGCGLFLIGSGVRGPRGRKRRRAGRTSSRV